VGKRLTVTAERQGASECSLVDKGTSGSREERSTNGRKTSSQGKGYEESQRRWEKGGRKKLSKESARAFRTMERGLILRRESLKDREESTRGRKRGKGLRFGERGGAHGRFGRKTDEGVAKALATENLVD